VFFSSLPATAALRTKLVHDMAFYFDTHEENFYSE
jgi:hypothetical protein